MFAYCYTWDQVPQNSFSNPLQSEEWIEMYSYVFILSVTCVVNRLKTGLGFVKIISHLSYKFSYQAG